MHVKCKHVCRHWADAACLSFTGSSTWQPASLALLSEQLCPSEKLLIAATFLCLEFSYCMLKGSSLVLCFLGQLVLQCALKFSTAGLFQTDRWTVNLSDATSQPTAWNLHILLFVSQCGGNTGRLWMDWIDQMAFIWKVTGLEQMHNKKKYMASLEKPVQQVQGFWKCVNEYVGNE